MSKGIIKSGRRDYGKRAEELIVRSLELLKSYLFFKT
jgi:uncharacterized protein YeeX (DUF496 family)